MGKKRLKSGSAQIKALRAGGFKVVVDHRQEFVTFDARFGDQRRPGIRRVTVVRLLDPKDDALLAVGVAVCHPGDRYNKKLGLTIAVGRARKQLRSLIQSAQIDEATGGIVFGSRVIEGELSVHSWVPSATVDRLQDAQALLREGLQAETDSQWWRGWLDRVRAFLDGEVTAPISTGSRSLHVVARHGIGQRWDVFVNGYELSPARSRTVMNHSPDGFAWGYLGSGPSQLALALLLEAGVDEDNAVALRADYRDATVAGWGNEVDVHLDPYGWALAHPRYRHSLDAGDAR